MARHPSQVGSEANRVLGKFRQMLKGSDEIFAGKAGKTTDNLGMEA